MLKKLIQEYNPINAQEIADKQIMLEFIEKYNDCLLRDNKIAHFTASSWIINKEKTKSLMIYHNTYNSWAWTGGHADGMEDLAEVAMKEASEETGIKKHKLLSSNILTLEILPVQGHMKKGKYVSGHLHLNLTFLIEADESEELEICEEENSGVKWINNSDIMNIVREEEMKIVYKKILEKI